MPVAGPGPRPEPRLTRRRAAVGEFQLNDGYKVPKGALVFPDLYRATIQGFPDSDRFDPDRFSPERSEDIKFGKAFLTFGTGSHYCVGREVRPHALAGLA